MHVEGVCSIGHNEVSDLVDPLSSCLCWNNLENGPETTVFNPFQTVLKTGSKRIQNGVFDRVFASF